MFKDAMLWRFLGIASSTVGLVCYALSSSFRHLYGKWSILTITLYVVVSSIISFITLFAENLKGWRYFGLKAHVVFLVLMATSLYSVFYDKTVDGKPDTLSVISNGAFSLMSLSLSRQTNVGFESGISNFFLGCLTVQLMKINWMLTSAAALFCYLVIVVRSHLDSQAQLEVGPVNANDSVLIQLSQGNSVQPIGNIAERFHALCLKDSGVLYEDPYVKIGVKAEWRAHQGRLVLFLGNESTSPLVSVEATIMPRSHLRMELSSVPETIPPRAQVECPLEVINLRPSRDVAVLDFSYKIGNDVVNVKLRLPAVLNKFLHPISVSAEEFFPQWRSLSGPPLKLQEVVRGVRPLPLNEMANLFSTYQLAVCPGLDPNPNNLVASTTFYSENTRAMLCLIRIETDPADRTQLRMTVGSGDPELTFELKEFIKELLVSIPMGARVPA